MGGKANESHSWGPHPPILILILILIPPPASDPDSEAGRSHPGQPRRPEEPHRWPASPYHVRFQA